MLTAVEVDSGEVVGGDGGSGSTRARPPVVLGDEEDAQAMRKTTAMSSGLTGRSEASLMAAALFGSEGSECSRGP